MADASEKICVLCGESCAGQPRTKDRKGRYYHQHCHDQALEEKRRREAARQHAEEQSAQAAFVEAEPPLVTGDNDEVMSMLLDDAGAPVAPPVQAGSGGTCPSCGQSVAPGAVLCVNCGFNLQSGQAVETNIDRSAAGEPSRCVWPIPIGVLSIVVALISLAGSAWGVMDAVLLSEPKFLIREVIPVLFALWLLSGAIGILQRRSWGFRYLRAWSIWKTIVTMICGGAGVVAIIVARDTMEGFLSDDQKGLGNILIIAAVIGLVWELWWAIFCLVWTHRDKVQSDVSDWV